MSGRNGQDMDVTVAARTRGHGGSSSGIVLRIVPLYVKAIS